jgi:hypothetical protein
MHGQGSFLYAHGSGISTDTEPVIDKSKRFIVSSSDPDPGPEEEGDLHTYIHTWAVTKIINQCSEKKDGGNTHTSSETKSLKSEV